MTYPIGTAAAKNLASCSVCATMAEVSTTSRCGYCNSKVHLRKPHSLQRSLAYLFTAMVLYVPANTLTIMETVELGHATENTIAGGVVKLWHMGSYPIAAVIFVASLVVPILKMTGIGWLCWFASRPKLSNHKQLTTVLHLTELIGKWSMVDVFVVALLVALVQVGVVMTITPGPAALAFAGVVICTMLSAQAFDVRLIWDKQLDLQEDQQLDEQKKDQT